MNIKGQGATGFPAGPPSFGDTWPLLFHRLEISVPTIVAPVRHGRGWSLMEYRDVVIVKSQQVEGVVLAPMVGAVVIRLPSTASSGTSLLKPNVPVAFTEPSAL